METINIVSDFIFGYIKLKPHIVAIVNTVEFQRLRFIWQLGVTPFVHHTADHSRFEHSIGTYHLASQLIKKIKKQLKKDNAEINISKKHVKCVEIAALCHDIGHGPFSHVWDNVILPGICNGIYDRHEQRFRGIWNVLKKNPKVNEILFQYDFNDDDDELICALVNGDMIEGKEILCGIVSNSDSGMDVDKWDYIARDSAYLGQASTNYRADIERMVYYTRAIKDSDGKWKIAFRDTECLNVMRVFQLRYYIHQTASKHRTVIAIQQMLLDGFKRCISDGIIKQEDIVTVSWILENNNSIFWTNVNQISEFRRILERKLYKSIFEAVEYGNKQDPRNDIIKYLETFSDINIVNVRIAFCRFSLGNNITNPILEIPFYNESNYELKTFTEKDLPLNLRINCDESRVLVYLSNETIEPLDNVNKIKEYLQIYFENNSWIIKSIV